MYPTLTFSLFSLLYTRSHQSTVQWFKCAWRMALDKCAKQSYFSLLLAGRNNFVAYPIRRLPLGFSWQMHLNCICTTFIASHGFVCWWWLTPTFLDHAWIPLNITARVNPRILGSKLWVLKALAKLLLPPKNFITRHSIWLAFWFSHAPSESFRESFA